MKAVTIKFYKSYIFLFELISRKHIIPSYKKSNNNISVTAVCATKKIRSFNSESEMIKAHTLRTM